MGKKSYNSTLQLIYSEGNSVGYSMDRRLGMSQSTSRRGKEI
jgi:hypothetical protein